MVSPQRLVDMTTAGDAVFSSPTLTASGSDVIDPGTGAVRLLRRPQEARAGVGAGARTTGEPEDPGRQGPVGVPVASVTAGGATGPAGSPVLGTDGIAVRRTDGRFTGDA